MAHSHRLVLESAGYAFTWDLATDLAQLDRVGQGLIWQGALLPLLWLSADGQREAVKATLQPDRTTLGASGGTIGLAFGRHGTGTLEVAGAGAVLKFGKLQIRWNSGRAPAIHSLYFGANVLTPAQRAAVPTLEVPFWPSWRSEGFAVASAKTNPMQSFFRSWDFGHTNIALGSFGPAMGTPYSAAFPRPTYGACAGGRLGWLCFGAGTVPDGALTFVVRSRSGAVEWRFREDLWGAPAGAVRTWDHPLWITWAGTAWEAYRDYFRLFPAARDRPPGHHKSFWGTWGDFRLGQFEWRSTVDRAVDEMEADLICLDDPWESRKGSGRPHPERLPTFAADIAYAHERKLGVGLWMPTGWLEDYEAEGLTADDVLLGRDGIPVRSNWAVDPHEPGSAFFCLDPSTPGTRRFLRERTQRMIREYRPTLLKIDFGYGMPGPDACAARDPAVRGERIAWAYFDLIAQAAREIDPTITVLGYSLHPLWDAVQDQISLDDLGDAGAHEASSHGQWSVWAALAADRGVPVMGSSGYLWAADLDVLQNSAILGAPGANLPRALPDGTTMPAAHLARRRGLFRWHRRTSRWTPLWLDSEMGTLEAEPATRNWGRLETIDGQPQLTALALREPSAAVLAAAELQGLEWSGRWVLLAQDDRSIFASAKLALIPLSAGGLALPRAQAPRAVKKVFANREVAFTGWRWVAGRLELTLPEAEVGAAILGFIVED